MNGAVEMIFWDVQHGNATYLNSPNGRVFIIDLGIGSYDDNNTAFSPLVELRNNHGLRRIDNLIITHPHLDHIDDILNINNLGLQPNVFFRPRHLTNEEVMQNIRNQDRQKFEVYCNLNTYYTGIIGDGHPMDTKNPANYGGLETRTFISTSPNKNNFNNHSIITVFSFAGIKVIIPGDNQKESFDELMTDANFTSIVRNADILLAPHHGRDSGLHEEFVKLVNPRLTIVSDGSFCDTSANPYYSANSRGWPVYRRSTGTREDRRCLTTNSDGEIFVTFGWNASGAPYLDVQKK